MKPPTFRRLLKQLRSTLGQDWEDNPYCWAFLAGWIAATGQKRTTVVRRLNKYINRYK